ncbi:ABC transporter transmembrane domain-containing protein [Nitratireductor sp. XY-223]|uniref:ABC transporter transmembrane domain-containing protein n=1 Tax=Nitratireductor sp. XY-223 TaxID=2561926 RepID=UPI0010A9EB4A|nr:ABC transporter transmembrane domain-containing protein [Nitratireductor sp. XY-223]
MAIPVLWTRRRLLQLSGLACIGFVQAGAALAIAVAGSRALTDAGDPSDRLWLVGAVVAATFALILMRVLQRRFAEAFALGYVTELRVAFMSHVIRIPADSRQMRQGLVMTRVVNDLSAIKLWLAGGLVSIVVAAATLSAVAAMLAVYQPALAIALAIAFAVWCIPVALCLKPLERTIRESRRQRGRIAARAATVLGARLTLLGFGRHGATVRGIEKKSWRLNAALVGRATYSGFLRSSGDLIFPAVVLSAIAGRLVFETGLVDAVSLGVLVVMAGLMATHLGAVALGLEYRLAHKVALARLQSVMDVPAIDPDAGQRIVRQSGGKSVEVRSLPLDPGARPVTFLAGAGEAVALDGLAADEAADLVLKLARLKRTPAGTVFLDGRDATELRARNWWRDVSVVSPDLPLIRASVSANGRLGARAGIDETERRRVFSRFGLSPEHEAMAVGEGDMGPGVPSAALRAARAVLRRSAVVVVADAELIAQEQMFDAFLDELRLNKATVIVATRMPVALRRRFRTVDLALSPPRAA